MTEHISAILVSFAITFILAIPFIQILYKFNIRRVAKLELDMLLPGRQVKFGTPIMGGAVIVLSSIILASVYLSDWEYFTPVILILIFGAIFGFIDEYVNTLGRTFKALRLTLGNKPKGTIFPVAGNLYKIKRILLTPWSYFEEAIRIMGSEQRGMKAHYKFLMQLILAAIPIYYLFQNGHGTFINLPWLGPVDLGLAYIPVMIIYFIGFINAFGITDGMDGLSAGTHSIAFTIYGILAFALGYYEVAILAFILLGAELAFLYFNIYPARMEMSDVGTMPIGVLFALIPILIYNEFSVLFIGAVFIAEILSSVSQQWSVKLTGKRIFLVAPIHHHFEKLGWPETKVTARIWLFGIVFGLIGLLIGINA